VRKQIVALVAAAVLIAVAAVGVATVLSRSGETGDEAALEAAGIEQNEPGGEGRPVALDPNGAKAVSAPGLLIGKRGSFDGDVRSLNGKKPEDHSARPEKGQPEPGIAASAKDPAGQVAAPAAPSPAPSAVFSGLDFASAGNGWPPDTNGDVGPNHFVQSVNTSIGIFRKTTGEKLASFSFNTLITGTNTLCDNNNYGDPVVLYDTFAGRWVISDFAFTTDALGNVNSDNYQCFAVSKTGDPMGSWWFYAFKVAVGGDIADYPKFGVWPDGIYMSANVFGPSTFKNAQVWVFDKEAFYRGDASPRAVPFVLPQSSGGTTIFSLLPSNARAQTGTPPVGRPNLFASIWGSYQLRVWKFAVDWTTPSPSASFTGPTNATIASFSAGPSTVPSPANALDTLTYRLMMQNQYVNLGGAESLWLTHTVGSSSVARVRWYELPVTGGTIASAPSQQSTWGSDTTHRFMPSLAVDKAGDMAVGYSVSSSSLNPGIRYAGRLVGDAPSTLGQGETTMAAGGGSQNFTNRWGDYATMTLDPDGCTFWFTSEIYATTGSNWNTKFGSFAYPSCTGGGATVLAAPTFLGATATSPTSVSLGWSDNATDETAYVVERATDGVTFSPLTTLSANAVSYLDTTAAASTPYSYRVKATNGAGSSGYSNLATVTTPAAGAILAAPTGLAAVAVSRSQINLTWSDASNNETGFKVERSTNGTIFTQIALLGTNAAAYSSTGLARNTTYYYRVRATNGAGDSANSSTASAKTLKR